jgi:DNA-binding CsgD family transcriptional regulator
MKTLAAQLADRQRTERQIVMDLVTPSELEVWRRVAGGQSRKEVGAALNKSVKTIDAHLENLRKKLGVSGIAGLVRAAVRYGVITVEVVS